MRFVFDLPFTGAAWQYNVQYYCANGELEEAAASFLVWCLSFHANVD